MNSGSGRTLRTGDTCLRQIIKGARLAALLVLAVLLVPLAPVLGRRRSPALVRWWHGRLLRALGITVHMRGTLPETPVLIVANHSTWLDIVVLGHVLDTVFISKAEIGKWPIIGVYARSMGTLLLARGANETATTSRQIHATLAAGRSVVLFPEGTTTRTPQPRRFHARLFAAAIDADHAVLPVALRYHDSRTPHHAHHPLVPWVDMPLRTNFRHVFGLAGLQVDLNIGVAMPATGHDRRSLADASRDAILQLQG